MTRPPVAIPAGELGRRIAGFAIVSCDIFDTAVMGKLARPEDAPLATGARALAAGLVSCSPEAFVAYRREAERGARHEAEAAGDDEVRLADVYGRLHAWGVVTDAEALAALGFAVDCALCQPVEAVRAALAARDPAQRLVFVSDTMLPGPWLARLLRECGYGEDCVVFSSADVRRSKHTGRMFPHLIEALGCAARDIVHIGDNPVSDIARAGEHGIATLYLPWQSPPPEPDRLRSAHHVVRLIHSHRRSRAAPAAAGAVPDLYRYFNCLLIGFSLFILAEARRRGITRIYFLSRDGYLPLAIARRLVARSGESVELRYLHVSRQSVIVPTLIDDIPRLVDDIGMNMAGQPLGTALLFLGIDVPATTAMLRDLGLDPDQTIDGPEPLRRLFAANAAPIRERLLARRDEALAYLGQEGFLDPGPRLIVDVGWRGSTQLALSRLTGIPAADIAGSYIGLLPETLDRGLDPRSAAGYLFGFGHPRPLMEAVLDGYILLEFFLSAPHGTVLHYAPGADGMVPVHAAEREPGAEIRKRAFAALEAGCIGEFERLDALLGGAWPAAIDPRSAMLDLEGLLTRPTAAEVAAINRIPFIHGLNGAHNVVACNPVPLHEWVLNLDGTMRRIGRAPWRSGTLRASLPWPVPDMTYAELRHRVERLRRQMGNWRFPGSVRKG